MGKIQESFCQTPSLWFHGQQKAGGKYSICLAKFLVQLLVLNLFLENISANLIKLPLKKYDFSSLQRGRRGEEGARLHRSERGATQQFNLSAMVNNLIGESGEGYFLTVNIGTPPQQLQVLIDTGSSNFAIACEPTENITTYFHPKSSSTYQEKTTEVSVKYTGASWSGVLGSDRVALTSAPDRVAWVNIACIQRSENFYPVNGMWQGIMGLGYPFLAKPDPSIVPFWDSMRHSFPGVPDVFSVQLCGSAFVHSHEQALKAGSLILGGVLPELGTSEFTYAPIHREWFYDVILTDLQVDGKSLALDCKELNTDRTIVDTGTTAVHLPTTVFMEVQKRIWNVLKRQGTVNVPHQAFFDGDDVMCYDDMASVFKAFPVVTFGMMSSETSSFLLRLSPQHYLRPVTHLTDPLINHSCVKFGFHKSTVGTILGAIFLEAFYVVFDRANRRVGFATTSCPLPDPANRVVFHPIQPLPPSSSDNFTKCAISGETSRAKLFVPISYVVLALVLAITIPLSILVLLRLLMWRREQIIHSGPGNKAWTITSPTASLMETDSLNITPRNDALIHTLHSSNRM